MREAALAEEGSGIVFPDLPTFFRGCCATASQGGSEGFKWAGYELARHAAGELRGWGSQAELDAALSELDRAYRKDNPGAIVTWFAQHFPRCMEIVPPRRHLAFARGVIAYAEDTGDLTNY